MHCVSAECKNIQHPLVSETEGLMPSDLKRRRTEFLARSGDGRL